MCALEKQGDEGASAQAGPCGSQLDINSRTYLAGCEKSLVREKDIDECQEGIEESLPGHSECSQGSTIIEAESQRQVKIRQVEDAWVQLQKHEVGMAMRDPWLRLSSLALSRVASSVRVIDVLRISALPGLGCWETEPPDPTPCSSFLSVAGALCVYLQGPDGVNMNLAF